MRRQQSSEHSKRELIEDLEKKLTTYRGVIFNFTQPAEDAVDEALTGLKSALAVKVYGPDLKTLEDKALEIRRVLEHVPGFIELPGYDRARRAANRTGERVGRSEADAYAV
jgi:heavy metal efflux system protein